MWKIIAILVIGLVQIEYYDHSEKIVYVRLHQSLVQGNDGSCQIAGVVILKIIKSIGPEWKVYITNDWVPSKKNPIDIHWAKELAKGY